MADYTTHNSKVFKVGLKNYADSVIKVRLVNMCKQVAQQLVRVIDEGFKMPNGTEQFPVHTANLHDATGVGVYSDGAIQHFIPTKRATATQSYGGITGIDGNALLQSAITSASTQFGKGIWIVLFSTVPYAYKVNSEGSPAFRGNDFFGALKRDLLNDVIANLKPITA